MLVEPTDEWFVGAMNRYPFLSEYTKPVKAMNRQLIGRDAEMRSLRAAFERVELSNVILLAEAGTGKALANGTEIPVNDERQFVPIEELQVGDEVFDDTGEACAVEGVFPQGNLTRYEVLFEDGTSIICNEAHIWRCRTKFEQEVGDPWQELTLREMMKEDTTWYVPLPDFVNRSVNFAPVEKSEIDAIIQKIVWTDGYGEIPDHIMHGNGESIRFAFVAAFGSDFNKLKAPVVTDKNLAEQLRELACARGLRAIIMHDDSGISEIDRYCVMVIDADTDGLAIASIIDLGDKCPMTCITVNSKHHVYLAGRTYTVTHNTALVQGTMLADKKRIYLEVDLSRMIAELPNVDELGNRLKRLFDEASSFSHSEGHEVVLFMDEFHQIVQLSPAAVEALKPMLADSATRGIRVIAATTYGEFRKYISNNQPLVERLYRLNLEEPDRETCVKILKSMAERYGVAEKIIGDALYEQIYEITNRYVPANAQPRKSILILDAMVGWHKAERRKLDKRLLGDVIFESEGVNIAFRVDPTTIRKQLDEKVLSQKYATRVVAERLQLCVADLNDHTKPMSSFLLTGSTGVGKSIVQDSLIPVFESVDGDKRRMKPAGEVKVGDKLFDRSGKPTKVLGVFPQGKRDVYRITFSDGRTIDVSDNHLWAVYPNKQSKEQGPTIYSTQTLLNKGLLSKTSNGRRACKYQINMNEAVQWESADLMCDPYVVGVFIGDGCLTCSALDLSSADDFIVKEIARLIGAVDYSNSKSDYHHYFYKNVGKRNERFQTSEIIPAELVGLKSGNKYIPDEYKYGSIEQRWALIQGLFDTDGSIGQNDGDRYNVSYFTISHQLALDVQEVLYSLGISSSIKKHTRTRECVNGMQEEFTYRVHVGISNELKYKMFRLPRKVEIAKRAQGVNRQRIRRYEYVGIKSIEKLDKQEEMVCFYVDNDEHLFQAGEFIVTHNTELTKQLSKLLFGDAQRSLIRIDATEYANPDSLERFRLEITSRVWERPYSILLIDEVEKACPEVTRVLLSVLDDGRLTDQNGREVSFLNCYIVLTTNAGTEIYKTIAQYEASDTGEGGFVARYDKLIRRSLVASTGMKFPPELLGRIDCIVPFQPLSLETMRAIVIMRLKELKSSLFEKYGIRMLVHQRVVDYLVEDSLTTDSDEGGARAVMSKLQSEVTTTIAAFINEFPEYRSISVRIEGELASENKRSRTSDAYVKVYGVKE